jgi:hypothetical protein
MQSAVPQNQLFRYALILIAAIETLAWIASSPAILGLGLFGFGHAIADKNPVTILVVLLVCMLLLLSISALVLAIKNTRLALSAAFVALAAVLWIVL